MSDSRTAGCGKADVRQSARWNQAAFVIVEIDERYINSAAASQWQDLKTIASFAPPTVCEFLGQPACISNPETFGTNWVGDLLGPITDQLILNNITMPFMYASMSIGGQRDGVRTDALGQKFKDVPEGEARAFQRFDAGREVAFDLRTTDSLSNSFLRVRNFGGPENFWAAKTPSDPNGDTHTIQFWTSLPPPPC